MAIVGCCRKCRSTFIKVDGAKDLCHACEVKASSAALRNLAKSADLGEGKLVRGRCAKCHNQFVQVGGRPTLCHSCDEAGNAGLAKFARRPADVLRQCLARGVVVNPTF